MTTYVYYDPNLPTNGSIFRVTQNPDESWSAPVAITIDGTVATAAADPEVTVLPNGTYLLAYTDLPPGSGGAPPFGAPISMAISTDGIHFTSSQPAFTLPSNLEVSDPAVVQLKDGSFLMSVGNFGSTTGVHGGVTFYHSVDGLNYAPTGVQLLGIDLSPEMVLLSDGSIRLFTHGGFVGGIGSYISQDNGQTWTQEPGLRLVAPDEGGFSGAELVSVIQAGPNAWDMVYQAPISPSGPNNPSNDQLVLATSTDGLNFTVAQVEFEQKASSPDIVVTPFAGPELFLPVPPETIQNDYLAITRTALPVDQATAVANSIYLGTTTETQYVNGLLSQVANTTVPAVAVEASMYGAVGSSAVITSLVTNFLPGQLAYAMQVGLDPQTFACLETALVFAFANESGSTAFANNFGPSNAAMPATAAGDAAFATAATNAIFGSAQTANTAPALLGYVHFLEGFFTANGIVGVPNPTPDQIVIAARAGAWGEGIAIAEGNNLGPFPGQTTNFLEDAAQGTPIYSASLSSQPTAAPFQGVATASAASTASSIQVTGVAAHVDHIGM